MRWMLARIMVLNLLSLYTLIIALFGKTDGMMNNLLDMERQMKNQGINFGLDLVTEAYEPPKGRNLVIYLFCTFLAHCKSQLLSVKKFGFFSKI